MALTRTRIKDVTLTATDILDDSYLVADADQGASTYLYEKITGNILKKIIIAMQKDAKLLSNVGISVVANTPTNGLTIALKQSDGSSDPATTHKNKCVIAFRSSTLATGALVFREVTAALSTVITSGSTAGFAAGIAHKLHLYAIDNAGSVELAWSGSDIFDESSLHNTTSEGGAGGADSVSTLYSTTARTNISIRYIGFALLNEATPGTWVTGPTQIFVGRPPVIEQIYTAYTPTFAGLGTVTAISVFYKKINDELFIYGKFTTGTTTGVTATMSLPSGFSVGGVTSEKQYCGELLRNGTNAPVRILATQNATTFTFGAGASQHGDVVGSSLLGNTETVYFKCSVRIAM